MSDPRRCPFGDDCDLTVAWMAGQQEARDTYRQRIEQLTAQLGMTRVDADQQRARATDAEARIKMLCELHDTAMAIAQSHVIAAQRSATDAKAEAARLREALELFAEYADRYDPVEDDDEERCWVKEFSPTLGELRRARAALGGQP